MQKISSYLYPNRINVVADVALFPTRWKIVYQNRVKIYKGVDNLITFDIKNADQKRIDVSAMNLKMAVMDVHGKEVTTVDITQGEITGLATANLPEDDLANIDPQFLKFTVYRENDNGTKTIFYADSQFGAVGQIELFESAIPIETPPVYITTFNPITNADASPRYTIYYSDAVEISKPNWLNTLEADEVVAFEFSLNKAAASITIQFTKDTIINNATHWEDVLGFGVFEDDVSVTKEINFPRYNRDVKWARVKFFQQSYIGAGAFFTITKDDGVEYQIAIDNQRRGKDYKVGEVYTIDGSRLGGEYGTSPNGSWQIEITSVDGEGGIRAFEALAEAPIEEAGTVIYRDVPLTNPPSNLVIDKVTIRL